MVFESIVVDLLNRVLGDYFENLDTSQLKLGIWGGDVVLKDLVLKTSAMDDLGLPFKVVIGKLGVLTVKIPWQSLYTAPVELNLQKLFLLVVPSYSVVYNEDAEELAAQAAKQKEIARIDEIRKREQQKKAGTVEPAVADTFSEKLITQIIKNVQIRIESIHIRYEDCVTSPKKPFAFGAVLKSLHMQTTDKNWNLAIITETVQIIYKMAKLEGLSVYWNSKSDIISKLENKAQMLEKLEQLVDSGSTQLTHVLGPISSHAKVKLTPSPERGDIPFSQSKFVIDVVMEELGIGLTNTQFQDAMTMAEAMDSMSRAQHYRKYRPKVLEHKGHYKEWWKFAYRCVVEEDVRRRQLNWDWKHIKNHRRLVKVYADAYYQKLTSKKLKPDIEAKVQQCEKALDVFNITLVRKQVEMKVERQGHKEEAAKPGWFSGWFGGSSAATPSTSMGIDDIAKKMEEALTPDEKRKLYQAIDYTEGALPVDYPEEYLEYKLNFTLKKLKCVVWEVIELGTHGQKILDLEIANVENMISTRPVRNGFNLSLEMGSLEAVGVQRGAAASPYIISSKSTGQDRKLIEIVFQTNPLHSTVSQKLNVTAAPVEIVYDSTTVCQLVKCFTLPPEIQLSKLQAVTVATLNEWKEQSAASLQHMIDTRGEVEIIVDLIAPYLLIPEGGALDRKGAVLVLDLGEIHLKSKPRPKDGKDFKAETSGKTKEQVRQLVVDRSYDSFLVTLTDFQVLLALPEDDYRAVIGKGSSFTSTSSSPMHLIRSDKFTVQLDQCLVQDDPTLPKVKLAATLPLLDLNITEERLLELLKLVVTLPFPASEPTTNISSLSYNPDLAESVAVSRITYSEMEKKKQELAQFTELKIFFTIMAIRIRIMRPSGPKKLLLPLADFELKKLEAQMTSKTFRTEFGIYLGGLALCASTHSAPGYPAGELFLLKTPMTEGHLFTLHMSSIGADCPPQFASKVKQEIKVKITTLDVILHQQALHTIINFVNEGVASFNRALDYSNSKEITSIFVVKHDDKKPNVLATKSETKKKVTAVTPKKHVNSKDVILSFQAHLNRLTVQLSTEDKNLMKLVLGKLDMSFEQRPKKSTMAMELTELQVLNLDPTGFYKTIMTQDNDKVVNVQCVMYDEASKGQNYLDMNKYDMKILVQTGSPRIVYLNSFVEGVMNFVDNFQVAKDAVVENVAAAAEAARENVEQVYSSGSRILIDVEFKTPHIIIPRNTHSSSALLADLGNLSVKNTFKLLSGNDATNAVIVDEIRVELEDMKMSRIIVEKETQRVIVECLMLEPVTLRLSILRNLSAEWYTQIPSIEIKGEMERAVIKCSSEDYQILMACVTENVSASSPPPPPVKPSNPQLVTTVAVVEEKKDVKLRAPMQRSTSRKDSMVPEVKTNVPIEERSGSVVSQTIFCKLKVEMLIKETGLIMYGGSSKLEGETGLVKRNDDAAFANFKIDNIEMAITMWSNDNLNCIFKIKDLTLHDIRPGEREITNLIYRKSGSETDLGPDSGIIKVTFRTDAAGKQGSTVNVETSSLSFVLCVDYLTLLAHFFTSSELHKPGETDLEMKYQSFPTAGDPGPVREITAPVVRPRRDSRRESVEEDMPMQIFFSMAETDVILVETMDKVDTNALLLNCEVSVKVVVASKKTNMMATINKIRLSTCTYDPDSRKQSLAEVISPMSITVVLNTSPLTGTLIDVNISDIFIRLTAGTLELLIKISAGMGTSSASDSLTEFTGDFSDIWDIKDNSESNLWFLKPDSNVEVGVDALGDDTATRLFDLAEDLVVQERLILESGCIVLTFETGSGNNSTPVLLVETDIDLQIFDWSTRLQMAGRMKLEAAYYNAVFGMWEFLVEPVETRHHGKVSHRPWELFVEYTTVVCGNADAGKNSHSSSMGGAGDGNAESRVVGAPSNYPAISFQSNVWTEIRTEINGLRPIFQTTLVQMFKALEKDILELTVTKTALDVLTLLSEDFQEAVKSLVSQKEVSNSAYTIVNDCGVDIKLNFVASAFALVRKGVSYEEALMRHGTTLNLGLVETYDLTKHHTSILKEQEGREERLLNLSIEEYSFSVEIPVNRAEKRYYSLHRKTEWGGTFAIIVDTTVKDTSKVVTIRGLAQIVNHLKIPVDVYSMNNSGDSVVMIGTAEREKPFNIPLTNLYTKTGELYFAPKGYTVSSMPYVWTSLMKDLTGVYHPVCRSKEENKSEFHVKIIGEVRQTLHEGTNRKTLASQCCYIHLKPPLVINNLLPVKLIFSLHNKTIGTAEKGHSVQVTELEVGTKEDFRVDFKIPDYDGQIWRSEIRITKSTPELSPWLFTSDDSKGTSMFLGIHKDEADDIITLHVYSPFWMINRTGLDLAYEAEDQKDNPITIHHASKEEPLLFAFRGKSFFSKKRALVRVNGKSDWSTKFSLDVAGSCGSVICKSPTQDYEIGIEIILSGWGLTKSVIFTPRYYVINQCSFRIDIAESERPETKIKILARKCIPFWPKEKTPHMIAQLEGTPEVTKPFRYDRADQTLLQLQNKYAGVHVDVHITEGSHVITFSEFVHGQAAVFVVNHTQDNAIELTEKGTDLTRVIPPNKNQLVTWYDPMGEKTLCWSPSTASGKKHTFTDKLEGDGYGSYKWITRDGREVEYDWVSFLDGLQRVLLFTADRSLVSYLQTARDTESPTADYTLMLHGLGVSLVNNSKYTEIMYLRIASSDIAWESQKEGKHQRFKPLKHKQSSAIEVAYQNYMNEKVINPGTKSHLSLDGGIELDFVDMKMYRPYERTIRRVFQTGIWLHYKSFPHTIQLHAKLYRIQIDNQLPDCIFRTVLAPVPPPRSVSLDDDIPKPFAEVSVMQRMTAHSSVIQFKYFKVLIQEFLIKLDISFVNAVVELFSESGEQKLERMVEYFAKDYDEANTSLEEFLSRHIVSQGQKNFYDFLHFSPLKIHVSFSMGGATKLSNSFLSLLIASLGVSVTEVQDVVFKLACMELQHMFLTGTQLYNEAYAHYTSQGLRQLYVLVFGLDVIGNPYGLFVGFTQGVGAFFYEPFHGAIQGPGEFAEGLALGVKSLVGHTIGGMSGAMSKITGTFGKGVAALTLDEEYQRKRRENISKRHTAAEGFVESGKDLVMGFVDGFSGVFTKPFKGAKEDGVEGFFKGLGKGAIGLVVRPTAGVIDFTSGSFDAVKKATSVTEDIQRMRPPRYIPTDTVLQPYILHEAEGMFLLNELEKGKYINTDTYIAHALINPHGVYVLLLTNKRIFYIKRVDIFGGWGIQWSYLWEHLAGPPDIIEKGLSFKLKPHERKKILRCNQRTEVVVPLYSADVCTWMLNKIETAMRTETGIVAHSAESDENVLNERTPLLKAEESSQMPTVQPTLEQIRITNSTLSSS